MSTEPDIQAVHRLNEAYQQLTHELGKVIVGQKQVIKELLVAMFARGHCLLVGVPGLAKTLTIRTVADALALKFSRIQFTPDLMPSDITGTEVIQEDRSTGTREFRFIPGPVFANVILADEINRTPPKTQAALLEAMQEHQVTAGGQRHVLPEPFFVLATQNPIEQEGTYPLPEAQMDRFILRLSTGYPDTLQHEGEILARRVFWKKDDPTETLKPVVSLAQFRGLRQAVESEVFIHEEVIFYIAKLVRTL
ncbi:MAG TPA: AAA family ATPase, partial [Pirellulaceae bacterium]|nr:AAA family ATPase [Pirellulaceae bacterium]